ncbi:MAG: A24 family peptidase [Coriobacteriia bacterium]|nr:A24 family peptidase [Coriobacteriia bacterium]
MRDVVAWAALAVTATFILAARWDAGMHPAMAADLLFLEHALVTALLSVAVVTDIRARIIPNAVPVGIVALHAVGIPVVAACGGGALASATAESVAGAAVLGGGLLAFTVAYEALRGGEAMGGGDLKLVAALGFALGIADGAASLFAACVAFALVMGAKALAAVARRQPVPANGPFAPALAAGAFLVMIG